MPLSAGWLSTQSPLEPRPMLATRALVPSRPRFHVRTWLSAHPVAVSRCAEGALDARERSTAECGVTGASQEPGRCKHQSSSELAGGGASGIGQNRPRRTTASTSAARAGSTPEIAESEARPTRRGAKSRNAYAEPLSVDRAAAPDQRQPGHEIFVPPPQRGVRALGDGICPAAMPGGALDDRARGPRGHLGYVTEGGSFDHTRS
jgi:hypothetical protein